MRAFMRMLDDGELITTSETDNLQPQQNIYPDQDAPMIRRRKEGGFELASLRWGG